MHFSRDYCHFLRVRRAIVGESYSVRDFLTVAAECLDMDWKACVQMDERYLRPSEVDSLQGDATKAREKLGWSPRVSFQQLVHMMVECDLKLARKERTLIKAGH